MRGWRLAERRIAALTGEPVPPDASRDALRVLGRLIQIQRVLVRHGLDDFVRATHLYRPLRFLFFISPWTWFQRRSRRDARANGCGSRSRSSGPIFVKFGQTLSTRRDLLPRDIADELAKLQDKRAAVPGRSGARELERAYGAPLDELFADFERRHRSPPPRSRRCTPARSPDGREVIVKVLRPGMRR